MDRITLRHELTQERLKELLHYDPNTGVFTWREPKRGRRSPIAGGKVQSGGKGSRSWYVGITLDYVRYMAHRLAFLYMVGRHPEQIDHINHDGLDNRWSNLREVTAQENALNRRKPINNTNGDTGLHFNRGKWQAMLGYRGKRLYLGRFDTKEQARDARRAKLSELGFHDNHGN